MENKAKKGADKNAEPYKMEPELQLNELNMINIELNELNSKQKLAANGRIARTIAHEVRNPLTNISLASDQLRQINPDNNESDLLLGMIDRNVSRINQLLSDLLYATKVEQLIYTPADINQLVDEALELARPRIEQSHIKVEKNYDETNGKILVDKEKIKLAFLNIIINAVEAMDVKPGILEINTINQPDKCIIEFKDNGTGFDDESMQRLFEPYFTTKVNGSGLGLTFTQNIIINHKGSIKVDSNPGQGSTCIVILTLKVD